MNISLNNYVVRTNGSINTQATLEKFQADLVKFEQEKEAQLASIGKAIHALFDQYRGARLNTPFVTGEVLRRLDVQPESYKSLSDKVQEYLHLHSQGKVEDGVAERPNSLFVISKGKGGGVGRRADLKDK